MCPGIAYYTSPCQDCLEPQYRLDLFLNLKYSSKRRDVIFQDLLEQDSDATAVMDCLIENKLNHAMDKKCAAGVEHHQIVCITDVFISLPPCTKQSYACTVLILYHTIPISIPPHRKIVGI